jgi:hypothetical protein
MMPFMTFT